MRESELSKLIVIAASAAGHRLFRQNVGRGWMGEIVRQSADLITLKSPRVLHAGLCVGSSDLIGWTRGGLFAAIEVKVGRNRATKEQLAFVGAVNAAGGVGAVVYSVNEAMVALNGED